MMTPAQSAYLDLLRGGAAQAVSLQECPLFQILRPLGVPNQPWFFGPFGSGRPFWTISI